MSHSQLPIHLSHFHIRRSKWSGKISQAFNPERSLQQERSSLDHISVDPNGFNPRSHERGIDGSTTSETSLTKYSEAASRQAATSFSQNSAGVKDSNQKIFDKSHHHQKKLRILFFHKIQKMMKKNLQNTKTSNQKKASKKSTKFDHEKKINKNPTKTKKLAARGGSPQPHFNNQQG